MEKNIIAKVGTSEITQQEVFKTMQSMPREQMAQFSQPDGRRQLVEEMVLRELLYLDAKDQGFDKDEDFLADLAEAREFALKQYAVRKLINAVEIDDEDIKDYYEGHPESFKTPDQVQARHILVDDEEKAREILNEIKAGKDFGEAAKEYSSCPSKERGGDLGLFTSGQMVKEFDDVAFALEVGELSHVVKTQFGYHLILVEEKKERATQTFEEVKDQLKQFLLQQRQSLRYVEYTSTLKGKYPIEINEEALQI